MEKLTKEQFFTHLDSLTILELSDYIKEFEARYGISAAAAAPVMMAGAAPAADAKPAEEKPIQFRRPAIKIFRREWFRSDL